MKFFSHPVWRARRRGLDRATDGASAMGERGQAPAYSESLDVRPLHFSNRTAWQRLFHANA